VDFLRLLFTEYSLQTFLQRTNPQEIKREITTLDQRLKNNEMAPPKPRRIRKDPPHAGGQLTDLQGPPGHYEKANANHELVLLEIDRLENKIKSLAEISVNRQEPDFISAQVDQVTGSMLETEKNDERLAICYGPGSRR